MVCYDKWEYNEVLFNNARGDIINSHAMPFHLTQHIEIPIHHLYKFSCHSGLYYVPYTDTSVKKRLENVTNVNKVPRSLFFYLSIKRKKMQFIYKIISYDRILYDTIAISYTTISYDMISYHNIQNIVKNIMSHQFYTEQI